MPVEKNAVSAAKSRPVEEEPRVIEVRVCVVCEQRTALAACPRCGHRPE